MPAAASFAAEVVGGVQSLPAPPARTLHLSVFYDLTCPWSRLGIHRLVRALGRRRGLSWTIGWEPFLLHAEMPRAGIAYPEYERQKYGSLERARRIARTVTAMGRGEGLVFAFGRIARAPSTLPAHRLIGWAAGQLGTSDRLAGLVMAVFTAHFERGEDISLPGTLATIAAAHGLDPDAARDVLRGRGAAEQVAARSRDNLELGMNGIPCILTEDGWAIAGAQEPIAIDRFLDVALTPAGSRIPAGTAAHHSAASAAGSAERAA